MNAKFIPGVKGVFGVTAKLLVEHDRRDFDRCGVFAANTFKSLSMLLANVELNVINVGVITNYL